VGDNCLKPSNSRSNRIQTASCAPSYIPVYSASVVGDYMDGFFLAFQEMMLSPNMTM
jgi:hypothetical protein